MKLTQVFRLSLFLCCITAAYLVMSVTSDTFGWSVSRSCTTSINDNSGSRLAIANTTCQHGWSLNPHPHSGRSKSDTEVGLSVDSDGGPYSWISYYWFGQSAPSGCDSVGSTSQSAKAKAVVTVAGSAGCSSSMRK